MRFFAALAVVFFHFGKQHLGHPSAVVMNVANGGARGVTLFFILSGFVLAYNYAAPERTRALNKVEFWKARFARIYPVYFVALLLTVPRFISYLDFVLRPVSPSNIVKGVISFGMVLTLTQAWDATRSTVWNYPAWTLSVEMLFYLTFPWTCAAVCRLNPRKALAAIWAIALMGSGIAYLVVHGGGPAYLRSLEQSWPPFRMPEFLIGLVLGRLYVAHPEYRIRRCDLVSVLALFGVLAVMALGPLPSGFGTRLLEPLFGVLIYALASGTGRVAAFLSTPLLVLLGEASYALYILQVPVMSYVYSLLGNRGLTFLVGVVVLTAVSIMSFLFFETPVRKWLKGKWSAPELVLEPRRAGA